MLLFWTFMTWLADLPSDWLDPNPRHDSRWSILDSKLDLHIYIYSGSYWVKRMSISIWKQLFSWFMIYLVEPASDWLDPRPHHNIGSSIQDLLVYSYSCPSNLRGIYVYFFLFLFITYAIFCGWKADFASHWTYLSLSLNTGSSILDFILDLPIYIQTGVLAYFTFSSSSYTSVCPLRSLLTRPKPKSQYWVD